MHTTPLTMIRVIMITSAVIGLAIGGMPVSADKPAHAGGGGDKDKQSGDHSWNNGFPSGEHFNLNIHGKKDHYQCDPTDAGGNSVFVPEYGDSQIDYIMNQKSDIENLTALDPCGTFDGDSAEVQLPAGEYQVYARILAKPQKDGEPREVVFYPSLEQSCDDSGTENFSTATDCEESFLLGTGIVTEQGAFTQDGQDLTRSADKGKGKGQGGKSTATDISDMFQWSGYTCEQQYDTDGDGSITLADNITDLNGDGLTDEADLQIYLDTYCLYHENTWVFDIADLVVYGWDYKNNGSKLVQIRFYPVDTTTFE